MAPKRKAPNTQAPKRARTTQGPSRQVRQGIGANQTEDDLPLSQRPSISSSSPSTRLPTSHDVPALTTLCARVFVANMAALYDEQKWPRMERYLSLLPDLMIPNLFSMLRAKWPTRLHHALITTHFLRGPTITLTGELNGVNKHTISAVARNGASVRELELSGFDKLADQLFASVIPSLPALRKLNFRASAKVGAKTVEAVAASCPELVTLNLSYTAVPPVTLVDILLKCTKLEALKVAGMTPTWTDTMFGKLLAGLQSRHEARDQFTLPRLQNLKLRQTALSDTTLHPFLRACPSLRRLDLAFTNIKHAPAWAAPTEGTSSRANSQAPPPLEKLVLTSTSVPPAELADVLAALPDLRVLHIGALGGGTGTAVRLGESALTLTDKLLEGCCDELEPPHKALEKLNLAGNTKLGANVSRTAERESALGRVIRTVGRQCTTLNLAGVRHLRSRDLAGLIFDDPMEGPPTLEVLTLDNTDLNDDAMPFIAACTSLRTLSLTSTKVTGNALFPVIDALPKLSYLNVTGCRGIDVAHRKRFFEVYEEWRERNEASA